MIYLCFILTCFLTLFVPSSRASMLDIACLYPSDSTGLESEAAIDAIQLAVDHINADPEVLPNYTLRVSYRNSGCDNLVGLRSFIDFIQVPDRNFHAILGALCSIVTGPVSELASGYNLSTVSYGSTSPSLTNNDRYPNLLLGTPSDINTVAGQLLFIRQHKFRRVAIMNQREEIFVTIAGRLQTFLNELEVEYTTEIFNAEGDNYLPSIELSLNRFQENGYRVIVANMYQEQYVNTLCLLRNFPSLQPPRTTWIVLGWYSSNWSDNVFNVTNGACTLEDIIKFSNGSPAVNPSPRFEDFSLANTTTISGHSPAQIFNAYKNSVVVRENEQFFTDNIIIYDAYAYDCTWTIALALNELAVDRNLTTTRPTAAENRLFFEKLQMTTFTGWTGEVLYFDRVRHDGRIQLLEIINGRYAFRGLYVNLPLNQSILATYNNFSYEETEPFAIFDENIASDGIVEHFHHLSIFIITLIFFLVGIGYVTALIVIISFGWFKKYAAVTKSEPSVNLVILSGVYLIFLLAFLWSIDTRFLPCATNYGLCTFMCHFRIWLLAVSISIIFGGMLGKAIKYYVIAIKHKFTYSKYLQFYQILLLPLLLTVIDTLYMLIWGLTSPITYRTSSVNSGLSETPVFLIAECQSQEGSHFVIFIAVLIALKSVLVLIGLFLAYHLRKVVNKANKYSSIISWTMYNILIFSIIIVLLLLLVPSVDLKFGLVCLFTLIEGFVISSIVAGPIVYYMYKDPHGKTFKPAVGNVEFPEAPEQLKDKIRTLESENRDLKEKITTSVSGVPNELDNPVFAYPDEVK